MKNLPVIALVLCVSGCEGVTRYDTNEAMIENMNKFLVLAKTNTESIGELRMMIMNHRHNDTTTLTFGKGASVYIITARVRMMSDVSYEATIMIEDTLGNLIAHGENGKRFYLNRNIGWSK